MKKKNGMNPWKKLTIIAGGVAAIGYLLSTTTTISVYVEAPEHIKANAGEIQSINDYIKEQQIQNKLLIEIQNQQVQQQQYYVPYNNQRQQAPQYPAAPRECWDYAEDGFQYKYDCISGNWL